MFSTIVEDSRAQEKVLKWAFFILFKKNFLIFVISGNGDFEVMIDMKINLKVAQFLPCLETTDGSLYVSQ